MPTTALRQVEAFLQGADRFDPARRANVPLWWLPAMAAVFGAAYGAVMGAWDPDWQERWLLVVYAAAKVPMLLLVTSGICLPAFFVLNTVAGLRADWREAWRAIYAAQAGLSITLAALAPVTIVWYQSTSSYRAALLFNGLIFALATLAGHLVMQRYYRPMIRRQERHRWMLLTWVTMYTFVGIQMAWMLRPFVGSPNMAVSFFRNEPFSNAYVVIAELILGTR